MFNTREDIWLELNRRLMARQLYDVNDIYQTMDRLPRIQCVDGFSVSVQADAMAYCRPRTNNGPWREVELGFPTSPIPELYEFSEGDGPDDTDTVWAYVPLELVADVIIQHGGLLAEVDQEVKIISGPN